MGPRRRLRWFLDRNSAPFPDVADPIERIKSWVVLLDGDLNMSTDALKTIWEALPEPGWHNCASGCLECLAREAILQACPGFEKLYPQRPRNILYVDCTFGPAE